MPGLVGIIGRNSIGRNGSDLQRMVKSIRHEEFYSCGTYESADAGVCVGWAVIAGGYADCMPAWNAARDCVLFFHGEHLPGRTQVETLLEPGERAGGGNARLVLQLYETEGPGFLRSLNGCFHGLLVDLRRQTILLFNDRLGMQRLYFAETPDGFLFASEAKALLAVRPELRSLDPRGVGEYLTSGCVLENRTLFRGVFALPGSSCWTFRDSARPERGSYFSPTEWEQQTPLSPEEAYQGLPTVVRDVVTRHANSRQRVGISLSGGLDTRLIMAYLEEPRDRFPCYTFCGIGRESYDVKIARRVAAARGQPHHVISLDDGFLRDFPALSARAVYLSDGGLGAEGAYELFFNQRARRVADIRVTGNYGSEVFRRLRQLGAFPPDRRMMHPDFHPQIEQAVRTYEGWSGGHEITFTAFRQAPWYGFGRLAVEQSQVAVRNPFLDQEFLNFMYRTPLAVRGSSDLQLHAIEAGSRSLLDIPTDRAERGRLGKVSSPWDHAWLWFLFKADYCYKSGMPQWLEQIHYWLRPLRPDKLVMGRHRFHYYRVWFREQLAGHLREMLLDPATRKRPYFDPAFVEHMVARHLKGDRNYTDSLEKVLSLELIHRQLLERSY